MNGPQKDYSKRVEDDWRIWRNVQKIFILFFSFSPWIVLYLSRSLANPTTSK
jgi:hypothetical protein